MVSESIPELCIGCDVLKICTRWNPVGTWDHTKGKSPCNPVPQQQIAPVIDAEKEHAEHRNQYRLRSEK